MIGSFPVSTRPHADRWSRPQDSHHCEQVSITAGNPGLPGRNRFRAWPAMFSSRPGVHSPSSSRTNETTLDQQTLQLPHYTSHYPQDLGPVGNDPVSPISSQSNTLRQQRYCRPAGRASVRVDLPLRYPHLSPYSTRTVEQVIEPPRHVPRSISQPVTPSYRDTRFQETPSSGTAVPGVGTGILTSDSIDTLPTRHANDVAFRDEHEFRLFVEATAGLESSVEFDPGASSGGLYMRDEHVAHGVYQALPRTVDVAEETPTIIQAMQQIASMPESTSSVEQSQREPARHSRPTINDWLESLPVHDLHTVSEPVSPLLAPTFVPGRQDLRSTSPMADELPDYASSQAQAQEAHRLEATRRAQELQRRWLQSDNCHLMRSSWR